MIVESQVTIDGSREAIWAVITDIENAPKNINGIEKTEILEKPENGLVGLKWRETRTMFGKSATEVMWITDCVENEFYKTRAESHGFVYISKFSVSNQNGSSSLTMTHESKPQGFVTKALSVPMGLVFKGMLRKAMLKDLRDIKRVVEQNQGAATA